MRRIPNLVLALMLLAFGFTPGTAHADGATISYPPVPGIHGHALWDSWFRLDGLPKPYEEQEYFVSGTAKNLAGTSTAPYTTRIIVTRPVNSSDFNGTVMLDWVNVTAQFENAVDTILAQEMLMREGFAFVHVSAQAAGLCCSPLTPKIWDPERYETLGHPGDDYAYDIFTQVARAMRSPQGVDPMAGLSVEHVIAAGQSQSADKLYTYVSQAQDGGAIDGFLIHGGGTRNFPHTLTAPVLMLLSDLAEASGAVSTDPNYRLWEVAGASHSDFWLDYHQEIGQGPRALADAEKQPTSAYADMNKTAGNYGEQLHPKQFTCIVGGSLFPMRYATSAAIHALNIWVSNGTPPQNSPALQLDGSGMVMRDTFGNALGGIRLPPIEVPVASYVSTSCELGGITVPFTDAQLNQMYPSFACYESKMQAVADARVSEGFMLPEDRDDLMARVDAARSRFLDLGLTAC